MQMVRRDARLARYSYSGMGYGAHVVGTGLEPCLETRPTRKSSDWQRRIITVKVPHNGCGRMQGNL